MLLYIVYIAVNCHRAGKRTAEEIRFSPPHSWLRVFGLAHWQSKLNVLFQKHTKSNLAKHLWYIFTLLHIPKNKVWDNWLETSMFRKHCVAHHALCLLTGDPPMVHLWLSHLTRASALVLGRHGSCFTNYPGVSCANSVPILSSLAVCIVRGIIFPDSNSFCRRWRAAETTVTSLTHERQGKYKLRWGECTALTYWLLLLFVLDVGWLKEGKIKKQKNNTDPVTRRRGLCV